MKSIVWIQSKTPSDSNVLVIDGSYSKYDSLEGQNEAIAFLQDLKHTKRLDSFISDVFLYYIIKKYQLPSNFKVYRNFKSVYIQAAISETDQYGRQLPFIIWNSNTDFNLALDMVVESSEKSNYSFTSKLINNYKKAFKAINNYILLESLIAIVIVLIISFAIWNLL